MSYSDGQVDASLREKRLVADRARLRAELRAEYLKQVTNPYNQTQGGGGYLFDPALQRWMSMRANEYHYFKPVVKNLWTPLLVFGSIALVTWTLKTRRAARENLYRTGQISYRKREYKFV